MLVKPSPKTSALMLRGNWLFWPLWGGGLLYRGLRAEGIISREWDGAFFSIFGILFAVNYINSIVALNSARQDAKKSQHPDPDIAALIDGEIDISEYRKRREHAQHDSHQ